MREYLTASGVSGTRRSQRAERIFLGAPAGIIVAAALCLFSLTTGVHAQSITRGQMELLESIDTRMDQMKPNDVSLDIGAGSILVTRLDAGASKIYPIVPYVSFRYSDWFALDENEARINIIRPDSGVGASGWRAGPMFKLDIGRPKFTTPDLRPLPKIGVTPELGGFVSYTLGPARARINVRTAVGGDHHGTLAELNLRSGIYEHGGFGLAAEVEASWASRSYMQAFYGITAAEATKTPLGVYTPGSGFRDVNFALMGQYKFNPQWSLITVTQYQRLVGPADDSPLTIRRGAANRLNLGTFLVYTF